MVNDQLGIIVQTILDTSGIDKSEFDKIQKIAEKYKINITANMDKKAIYDSVKSVLPQIIADINKNYNLNIPIDIDEKTLMKSVNQYQTEIEKVTSRFNKIQLSIGDNGNTTAQIEVLRNNFTKLGLSADEVKTKMSGVDTEVKTLQSLMNSGAENSAIVTQFEKLQTVLTQTQNNLKQTRSDYSLLATEQQRLSLANTIEAWNQKNTRATKEVRAENDRYVASLRDLNTQMTLIEKNNIQTAFKQNENSMRTLNRLGASLKDQMQQAASSFTQWISVSSAIMGVVYTTRKAVTELKDKYISY